MVHNRLVISTNRFGYQILCSLTAKQYRETSNDSTGPTARLVLSDRAQSTRSIDEADEYMAAYVAAASHIRTKHTGCITMIVAEIVMIIV